MNSNQTQFVELTVDKCVIRVPITSTSTISLSFSCQSESTLSKPENSTPKLENQEATENSTLAVTQEARSNAPSKVSVSSEALSSLGPRLRILYTKYSNECDALLQKGHSNIRKNLMVLAKCEGDLDKALSFFDKRSTQKKNPLGRCNQEAQCKTPSEAKDQDYSKELEILARKGFPNQKLNLKLLQKFSGDLTEVENRLNKRNQLSDKFMALKQQYSAQLTSLNQLGHYNQRKNLVLLKRFDGDLTLTLNKLCKCKK
jgi:hypothetical protein